MNKAQQAVAKQERLLATGRREHFASFAADLRTEGYYNLVGIKQDGTRVVITRGGTPDEGGDGHLGSICPIELAAKLNDDEDMAAVIGLVVDLVWSDDGMALVPAGQPFAA